MPTDREDKDMRSWKQRSLAVTSRSEHLTALRGHLSQRDFRSTTTPTTSTNELSPNAGLKADKKQGHSWTQWVGQKVANVRRGNSGDSEAGGKGGIDEIALFPGWATRRYHKSIGGEIEDAFGVDVFISGYASHHRPPQFMTRSQRAFLRLAKGFASLPKLQAPHQPNPTPQPPVPEQPVIPLSRSTEELLASIQLPPRPTEITEDYESKQVAALEEKFRDVQTESPSDSPLASRSISRSSSSSDLSTAAEQDEHEGHVAHAASSISSDLYKLHHNLETRLMPFWSSAISERTVRLSLYASPHDPAVSPSPDQVKGSEEGEHGPIMVQNVQTGSDGSFQAKFSVPWEEMCTHPGALHIAFGDPTHEHDLLLKAELLPEAASPSSSSSARQTFSSKKENLAVTELVSLTHSPVRVISDIDDTVKLSNIVSGARAVFYNVFVKELRDIVIPGMGEWYNEMWRRGVRFHYVSNGPFELIPVVNEFFEVSRLPPGSVRLKSYAGRSLFNGLLSAPATRKRAGILDILDNFLDSRFILIGDTGEQDLELYATIAKERPQQVLAVFVRDVGAANEEEKALDDPCGFNMQTALADHHGGASGGDIDAAFVQAMSTAGPITPLHKGSVPNPSTVVSTQPAPRRSMSEVASSMKSSGMPKAKRTLSKLSIAAGREPAAVSAGTGGGYFTSERSGSPTSVTDPINSSQRTSYESDSSSSSSGKSARWAMPGGIPADMSEAEKKRMELQIRVYRARTLMPSHVPLRIFRKPEECVEASEILDKLHIERVGSGA